METSSWALLCLTCAQSFKTSWSTTDLLVSHAICLCRITFRCSLFSAKQSIDSYENVGKPFSSGDKVRSVVESASAHYPYVRLRPPFADHELFKWCCHDPSGEKLPPQGQWAMSVLLVSQRWKTSRGQLIQDPGNIRLTLSPTQSTRANTIVSRVLRDAPTAHETTVRVNSSCAKTNEAWRGIDLLKTSRLPHNWELILRTSEWIFSSPFRGKVQDLRNPELLVRWAIWVPHLGSTAGACARVGPCEWVGFFGVCVLTMRQHNVLQGANHIEINDLVCGKWFGTFLDTWTSVWIQDVKAWRHFYAIFRSK